jgi:integrase
MAAKHLRPFIGHLPLRSVTPEKLEHLYAELLRCREHCPPQPVAGHVCRPLHPTTVRKLRYLLSAAFRRAVRWDWLDHSPTPDVELPAQPLPQPQPPTPAEAAQILGEAWKHPELGPMVWLAMATGARRGELCALRWRHLDLTQDVLVVQAGIAQANGEVWETDTKLHQRRHVALDPVTIAVLTNYHQERQQRAAAVAAGADLPVPPDGRPVGYPHHNPQAAALLSHRTHPSRRRHPHRCRSARTRRGRNHTRLLRGLGTRGRPTRLPNPDASTTHAHPLTQRFTNCRYTPFTKPLPGNRGWTTFSNSQLSRR